MIVCQLNKYSQVGGEVEILCPDGNVHLMLVIMMCLAMDHKETAKHCLMAASGCLSCYCPEDEFDSWTRRPGAPRLVEDIIWKIEEASAEYLEEDGIIKNGKNGKVAEWELENRIKLHWNICGLT
jgi:hypothetical protein